MLSPVTGRPCAAAALCAWGEEASPARALGGPGARHCGGMACPCPCQLRAPWGASTALSLP